MPNPRHYSMTLRAEQTAATRQRILNAAKTLFLQHGYPGTTLATIAEAAGVSVQTIYNVVGGKAAVLKAVYDTTLAGDDEPVPMAERPMAMAIYDAPTGRASLAAYATMARVLGERILPLMTILLANGVAGDPELREFAIVIESEHATGTRMVATHVAERFSLREGLDTEGAADILWTLTSPVVAERLVIGRGWSWDRYQEWMGTTIADALLGQDLAT